jgi:glycosyltransferase involved in cell wall biosynthesis
MERVINKLSIVVPAYNEERTIAMMLLSLKQLDLGEISKEIIVVNDASKDQTLEMAQVVADGEPDPKTGFILLNNEHNMGKSQSVKRGILASSGDLVVIQDADLEYEPKELVEFVNVFLQDNDLSVVYGDRFGKNNKVVYWQNWFGNRFLTLVSNLFTTRYGFRVGDMEVCYKMVVGDVMRELAATIKSTSNFGFEPEITAKLAKHKPKLKLKEIPITYRPRTIAEGKHMKAFRDGFKALREIITFNLFA